ncbi:hypothetical protein BDW22DRAFT_1430174 [Trametopsis cervina]|nr:hypothetical protein BDW22DRAFT_1430174 [Trametopsis cervina]
MSRAQTQSVALPSMHALVIGIDEYLNNGPEAARRADLPDGSRTPNVAAIGGPDLTGAVADARNTEQYLREHLGVPEKQICLLLNSQATRERIIQELRNLACRETIEYGSPILIYYAGHGGSGIAPDK